MHLVKTASQITQPSMGLIRWNCCIIYDAVFIFSLKGILNVHTATEQSWWLRNRRPARGDWKRWSWRWRTCSWYGPLENTCSYMCFQIWSHGPGFCCFLSIGRMSFQELRTSHRRRQKIHVTRMSRSPWYVSVYSWIYTRIYTRYHYDNMVNAIIVYKRL